MQTFIATESNQCGVILYLLSTNLTYLQITRHLPMFCIYCDSCHRSASVTCLDLPPSSSGASGSGSSADASGSGLPPASSGASSFLLLLLPPLLVPLDASHWHARSDPSQTDGDCQYLQYDAASLLIHNASPASPAHASDGAAVGASVGGLVGATVAGSLGASDGVPQCEPQQQKLRGQYCAPG